MSKSDAYGYYCAIVSVAMLCGIVGCGASPCGIVAADLTVKGIVIDEESGALLSGVGLAGRTVTDGATTAERKLIDGMTTAPDGSFELKFTVTEGFCGPTPSLDFPCPDRIEIDVAQGACLQKVVIEINDDTVVNAECRENVLELREAVEIVLPECD